MSLSGVDQDIEDGSGPGRPDSDPDYRAGRRWFVPGSPQLSPPVIGMLIFAGMRLLSVAVAAFLLGHGKYQLRHWSVVRWMRASDGGNYLTIAAHGYAYRPAN
jgi:hypothetical protein